MLFAVATFVGVLILVVGIYWVMLERSETREQGQLRKRLRAVTNPRAAATRIDFVKQADRLSAVKGLDAILSRTQGLAGSLQRLIARADVQITVGGLLLSSGCLFLGAWLVIGWITHFYWVGFAIGLVLLFAPYFAV